MNGNDQFRFHSQRASWQARDLVATVLVAAALALSTMVTAQETRFLRGDANGDGNLNIGDPLHTLIAEYTGKVTLSCRDAADVNDDGRISVGDPLHTLYYLFLDGREIPSPGRVCGVDPTDDQLDCESHTYCVYGDLPVSGETSFETPIAGGGFWLRGGVDDAMGPGAPPAAEGDPGANPAPGGERQIEESDIYKFVGDQLVVLNRYRGLQVIDLENVHEPDVVGAVPIFGNPKEMYVRDDKAYVIANDYYRFAAAQEDGLSPIPFHGSLLRIVDIADPTQPVVVREVELKGQYGDSRIVGDVLYLTSDHYTSSYYRPDHGNSTEILSLNIADPDDIRVVDTQEFPRDGWEQHLTVTPAAMYLAESMYQSSSRSYRSTIHYVDISDAEGLIRVRGSAAAPGRVQDRWSMDEFEQTLRVASGESWGNGDVYLTTFSVLDPDTILRLGGYTLRVNERLTSASFDGTRGYLVTYRNIDPLFTFDLTDPRRPELKGELEMTGWLDFMVPMGDRIVALGHEDIAGEDGRRDRSLAVSLIDVADLATPTLLSRVTVGAQWGSVPAERDDFAKVFRVLPEQNLLLFPFQSWDWVNYHPLNGVQLVDFDRESLTKRGLIDRAGWVERGIPYQEDKVLTLSSQVFQVLDIQDRDQPRLLSRLELARNALSFAPLPGGEYAVQLTGDWYLGDMQLTVTPIDDPNAVRPTASVQIPAPYGRMFVNGSMVYVASVQSERDNLGHVTNQVTKVQVVDLSDPTKPVQRGSVVLPELVWPGYDYWFWGSGDEIVQVDGSTLAFHRNVYQWWWWAWDCLGCRAPQPEAVSHTIQVVDLADADNPIVASTVKIDDADWCWGLRAKASGTMLYVSSYKSRVTADWQVFARYYLHRIELAEPANPVELKPVNIPGMFLDATPTGEIAYTYENRWEYKLDRQRNVLYALELGEEEATLLSRVEMPGYINGIEVAGETAVAASQNSYPVVEADGSQRWVSETALVTVDLSDPLDIQVAGKALVPGNYAYLRKVVGDRALLGIWEGIFSYDISDITQPAFEKFFRIQGWAQDLVVEGDTLYVPSGYHGIQVLPLNGR